MQSAGQSQEQVKLRDFEEEQKDVIRSKLTSQAAGKKAKLLRKKAKVEKEIDKLKRSNHVDRNAGKSEADKKKKLAKLERKIDRIEAKIADIDEHKAEDIVREDGQSAFFMDATSKRERGKNEDEEMLEVHDGSVLLPISHKHHYRMTQRSRVYRINELFYKLLMGH